MMTDRLTFFPRREVLKSVSLNLAILNGASMPTTYLTILLLSFLSTVTTCLGVLLAMLIRENDKAIACGIGFSTGIMILVSGLELIPEAYANLDLLSVTLTVCLGASVLWIANFAIPHVHLVPEHGLVDARLVKSVYLVVTGLILHDVPEGFAMANAYIASPSVGVLVALAIALHNLPEELAMAVPAIALRSKRFLIGTALLSALAEPAGAVIGLLAVSANTAFNAYFIAFAAGAMIFIALHELTPMARRYGQIGWFVAGLGLSIVVHRLLAWVTTG
jgi:ZIP family zinc transporter